MVVTNTKHHFAAASLRKEVHYIWSLLQDFQQTEPSADLLMIEIGSFGHFIPMTVLVSNEIIHAQKNLSV